MNLAELQRRFWDLATRAPGAKGASECFVGTPGLHAKARIDIYADMFVWRQVDALRSDFPKLNALLGDGGFCAMARAYLRAHPSIHPSLAQLGRRLAPFLAQRPAPASEDTPRPDLADLAALEWARVESFEEASAPVATAQLVQGRKDAASLRLRIAPSLRLLELRHDVVALWNQLEDGLPPAPPRTARTYVALWRKDFVVYHAKVDEAEALALRLALDGSTLGEICDPFAERPDAAAAALQAIASWFAEGWIAGER
jgi:hypothetical protein